MKKNKKIQLIGFWLRILVIVLVTVPVVYWAFTQAQLLLSRATGTQADIIIDTAFTQGVIKPNWFSFSQGGEESKDMVAPIISQTKSLSPKYIRLDHLYDHFDVVTRRADGSLQFNFSSLDAAVNSILATGALPFFSLSYMPPAISSGDILATPKNWNEWALVVQKTIEHYSGANGLNLNDIYYEVWNEPDLFGGWKYGGAKNYLTLYQYAAIGASKAQNVNHFFLGGPATTQLYKNWIVAFAEFVTKNNLRADFISWHRYNLDPSQYFKDVKDVTDWLFYYPTLVGVPRIISEWGFDSEINGGYDGNFAAAHAAATIRQVVNSYEHLFTFELVDGADGGGKKYWGRWGLLTHPSTGSSPKPRYNLFRLLQPFAGTRLLVRGEGSWVTSLAAKEGETIRVMLVNFDRYSAHSEQVPLTLTHLTQASYTLATTRLDLKRSTQVIEVVDGTYKTDVLMNANSVVFLEFTPNQ